MAAAAYVHTSHLWREVERHVQVLFCGARVRMLAAVHPALMGGAGGGRFVLKAERRLEQGSPHQAALCRREGCQAHMHATSPPAHLFIVLLLRLAAQPLLVRLEQLLKHLVAAVLRRRQARRTSGTVGRSVWIHKGASQADRPLQAVSAIPTTNTLLSTLPHRTTQDPTPPHPTHQRRVVQLLALPLGRVDGALAAAARVIPQKGGRPLPVQVHPRLAAIGPGQQHAVALKRRAHEAAAAGESREEWCLCD